MKLEPLWKPFTTLKEIPYKGTFLVNFDSSLGLQTTFVHGNTLYGYEEETLPKYYCKIPEGSEFFATFVSETFSATGYTYGLAWEGFEDTDSIKDLSECTFDVLGFYIEDLKNTKGYFEKKYGSIIKIQTTTTVSIQGHLFTNVSSPTIVFVGELTTKQKNTLWETSRLKLSFEDFIAKFQDFLDEKYQMSGASYEADSRWDAFVEKEYNENYSEYVC